MSTNKHQHIFAEDMTDEMCQFAVKTSEEGFHLTINKGQVLQSIHNTCCRGIYLLAAAEKAFV
jgi:hypothetical protein